MRYGCSGACTAGCVAVSPNNGSAGTDSAAHRAGEPAALEETPSGGLENLEAFQERLQFFNGNLATEQTFRTTFSFFPQDFV